ncbi:hypothetical protein DID80_00945 [Candidatus Marinamargulisbacteria bacterium SCGC AAA071-K20]|nr:hypothetical protein DID80_00945 [Candidatus Marinamargulisbacteria bacterium SCGC AAA071-K20]
MNFCPQNTNNFLLLIQSNSPGEVSNWVIPFIKRFKKSVPDSDIIVFLTPCQYSSNQEARILSESKLVSKIVPNTESMKHICSMPFKVKHSYKNGAVLFLGGDPLYSWILSKKYKLPCYGYSDHNKSLGWGYKKSFFKNKVGDLMSEKVNQFLETNNTQSPKDIDILFFTGSRPQHFKAFFPIVMDTIKSLKELSPNYTIKVHISPFITDTLFNSQVKEAPTDIEFTREDALKVMAKSKLLVTLAGTNTAEAMYLNLPMIVLFPLNFPDLVILDGLAGIIEKIPIIGPLIKKLVLLYLRKTVKFVSHPNRLTNSEIVPEIIGVIDSEVLASKANTLLKNKNELEKITNDLKSIPHPKNVSETILKDITNHHRYK